MKTPSKVLQTILQGVVFGFGFSIGSLLFNVLLQAALFGIFRVLGLGR